MTNKQKAFWVFLFILPLVVFALSIFKHRSEQLSITPDKAKRLTEFKQFSDKWNALPFIPIERSPNFEKSIKSIPINNSSLLESNQMAQLNTIIYNWVFAFHDGVYKSYHDFRVPTSNFTLVKSVHDFMKGDNKTFPENGEGMLKIYWDSYCVDAWTNYWKELNLTHSYVELEKATGIPPSLLEYVKTKENTGISQTGPMLTFYETPSATLTAQGFVLYATVCIVPRGDGAVFPVYCRFYWSEKEHSWLPEDMATAYTGPKRLKLLF
jgi:hypothetical protein